MTIAKRIAAILTSAVILGGCYGRPNIHGNASELARATGLQAGQPAIVVFSALWCHPCREEIDSLNQANREFANSIQFRGLLVEGLDKGSLVQQSDIPQFKSFTGASAEYSMRIDPVWKLFDSIPMPQGHALPTVVLLNAALEIEQTIQQSLDYDTQLRPLLQKLARGQSTAAAPEPKPTGGDLTDTVENWEKRAEVVANAQLLQNLTDSWTEGLKRFDFKAVDMPLESGRISFNWDGANVNTPKSAHWVEDTPVSHCTLDMTLDENGKATSMSGLCHPK